MSQVTSLRPSQTDATPLPSGGACSHCGGPVERGDRFCGSCGGEQPIEAEAVSSAPEQKHVRCSACGAELSLDPNQRSLTCPFCDSNYVVEFSPEQTGRQAPEFVVGFAVTRQQALDRFHQWIRSNSIFRPGDLGQMSIEDRLRGVYLPFWSFSMLARSEWSASIGEYWYRTETYTTTEDGKTVTKTRQVRETEWWPLAGKHHRYYSGYLVSGSRGLPQGEAERIKPFHLAALKRYQPYFLAGWLSEEYSVARDAALHACQQEFYRREQENVASYLPGDTYSDLRVATQFDDVNSDLILLPVYLLSYRYQDKLYRFMVNGQTGAVAGAKPLSWKRIVAVAAAGIVAVALAIGAIAALRAFM
jgi:hypothetical protein